MNKILLIAIAMVAMIGIVQANPFDGDFYNEAGDAPAPQPIILKPGVLQTFSFHADNIAPAANDTDLTYNYEVYVLSGSGNPTDITVTTPASFHPVNYTTTGAFSYTDIGTITILLDINAPVDTIYQVVIYGGSYAGTGEFDSGSAARNFAIPEFPTIALPIAAILGLAFIFQRRKEEE